MSKRTVVLMVTGLAVIGALTACTDQTGANTNGQTGMTEPAGPTSSPAIELPTLLVNRQTGAGFEAIIGGELGVNMAGCVTLEGELMVAPYGSSVGPDGETITLAGHGDFRLGEDISIGGGYEEDRPVADIEPEQAACAPEGETTVTLAVVSPIVE